MTNAPVPGLTQNDLSVPYCNESTVANTNTIEGLHFCPHLIEIDHNEIVDFLLFDEARECL